MENVKIEKNLIEYIDSEKGIPTPLGKLEFTNKDKIGQGGNGLVYSAKINNKKIAIKFLISDLERKNVRFKSEYFNTNYVRNELCNTVNMIHYGELEIQDVVVIPYVFIFGKFKKIQKYKIYN